MPQRPFRPISAGRRDRVVPPVVVAAPPAASARDDCTAAIARIDAVIQNARPTWFAQLGATVFAAITLLGVEDADFFRVGASTRLPLVGVDVPVTYFFGGGALVLTAIYIYLHLYLELLWDALGQAPARIPVPGKPHGEPLAQRILPWQVAEWGLRLRDWLCRAERHESSAPRRALSLVGTAMSVTFIWLFGVAVIAAFWWRSMPAHEDEMTAALGLLLSAALWIAVRSGLQALNLLAADRTKVAWPWRVKRWLRLKARRLWPRGRPPEPAAGRRPAATIAAAEAPERFRRRLPRWLRWTVVALALGGATVVVSLVRTASDYWPARWERSDDDFSKQTLFQLGPTPRDMLDRISIALVARADLREARLVRQPADWLNREEAERDYRAEWARRKGVAYADPFVPVAGRVLDADFQSAWKARRKVYLDVLEKPVLDGVNVGRANLLGAFLPGVLLRAARLEGANLFGAMLEGANLRSARLEGANLQGAILDGANLRSARLEGANLAYARLQRANLFRARLVVAILANARLQGADLSSAQLMGAELTSAELFGVDLRGARLDYADLSRARLQSAKLSQARLDHTNLSKAQLQGATLQGAEIRDALLVQARLEGANLSEARLFGTVGRLLDLNRTALSASLWSYTALRAVAIDKTRMTELRGFSSSFGDATILLPAGFAKPCHWGTVALSDLHYFGRWKGWVESNDRYISDLDQYTPIPPPEHCPFERGGRETYREATRR